MIPFSVDQDGRVKIRFGDLATLVTSATGPNPQIVDGIYLGHTPETRRLHGGSFNGEGHLFARRERGGELSFYLGCNLKMEYWSDGDDEPSYAVGINVWKTDRIKLTPSERDYVISLIKKRNMKVSV